MSRSDDVKDIAKVRSVMVRSNIILCLSAVFIIDIILVGLFSCDIRTVQSDKAILYALIIFSWVFIAFIYFLQERNFKKYLLKWLIRSISDSKFLETLMSSSDIFLICLNSEGMVEKASDMAMEELCGMSYTETVNKRLLDLTDFGDFGQMADNFFFGNAKNSGTYLLKNHITNENAWYYVQIKGISEADKTGHYLITFLKVTESVISSHTLAAMMDSTQNSVMVINESEKIVYMSETAAKHLGSVGRNFYTNSDIADIPEVLFNSKSFRELLEIVEKKGTLNQTMYIEYPEINTPSWWAQVNISVLYAMGQRCGYVIIMTDVSEHLQAKENAENAAKRKEDMLITVSHGVRNPMNVIVGTLDLLLLKNNLDPDVKEKLSLIKDASGNIMQMVDDIAEYTNIGAVDVEDGIRDYSMRDFISSILSSFYVISQKSGIRVYTLVEKGIKDDNRGNDNKIKQALFNMFEYACSIISKGYIVFTVSRTSDGKGSFLHYSILCHRDNENENYDRLNEDDETRIKNLKDIQNAIQLDFKYTVSREIVNRLKAELNFCKRADGGIEMSFEMPVIVSRGREVIEIENAAKLKVMLASKDLEMRHYFVRMLEYSGVSCMTDNGGKYNDIDFVFIDMDYEGIQELIANIKDSGNAEIIFINKDKDSIAMQDGKRINGNILYEPYSNIIIADCLNRQYFKKLETKDKIRENLFAAVNVKALVVDDNEVNLMIAKNMLELFKVNVETADGGKKAVEMAAKNRYDIIFMDHIMPDMDGIEATAIIRKDEKEDWKNIIVALSANLMPNIMEKFKIAGVSDFLSKPIEIANLGEMLRKWLPEDKITDNVEMPYDENAYDSRKYDEKTEKLRNCLASILELDFEMGLKYSADNTDSYIAVLNAAIDSIQKYREHIAEYIQKGDMPGLKRDIREIKIDVHSLKSLLLSLGVQNISSEAVRIETQINEGRDSEVNNEIPSFEAMVEKFYDELSNAMDKYNNSFRAAEVLGEELDSKVKKELLKETAADISMFEIEPALEKLEKLSSGTRGEEHDEFKKALECAAKFDYDGIMNILQKMVKEQ